MNYRTSGRSPARPCRECNSGGQALGGRQSRGLRRETLLPWNATHLPGGPSISVAGLLAVLSPRASQSSHVVTHW